MKISLAEPGRKRGSPTIERLVDADSPSRSAGDVRRSGDIEQCRNGVDNSGDRQCRSVGATTGGSTFDRSTGRHGTAGFTLVELMIVVAVVGILAAIGLPSYADAVRKSNRTSAESHLMDIAQRQQQYLLDNRGSYASSLSALNVTTPSDVSARYTISITVTAGPPPTFIAKATPTGAQVKDLSGVALTISNTGSKTPSGAW